MHSTILLKLPDVLLKVISLRHCRFVFITQLLHFFGIKRGDLKLIQSISMNPKLLKVNKQLNHSFSIRQDAVPYFYNSWHFHPEMELVHIQNGSGIQFIGDNISRFKKDDIILVGSNIPHLWRCDDTYFQQNSTLKAIATVTHFSEDFWGKEFLELPENKKIKELMITAKRGIIIRGRTRLIVAELMQQMLRAVNTDRIILLLQILKSIVAGNKTNTLIVSKGFEPSLEIKETERINNIYTYSIANFKEKISLNNIAKIANISPNSFCRYFKLHTRKTYNHFLQELRVGHACKLLIQNKLNITQVCYESGFNNVTNFYKSFKKITGNSPLEYQKQYLKNGEM